MSKKYLTQDQIRDYEYLCHERTYGRLLTVDGLRFICEANNFNPEKIGQHFLELLPKLMQENKNSRE